MTPGQEGSPTTEGGAPDAPAGDPARADGIRRRYSRWMAVYPPAWRREHGEALLGTFLEDADARRRTGPTARDAAGILRHGLAWRLRLLAPSAGTRRVAGLLALVSGTVLVTLCLLLGEWQPGMAATGWRVQPGHVGPFATLGVLLYAVWFAALLAVLAGRAAAARRLLAGLVVLAVGLGGARIAVWGVSLLVHVRTATPGPDLFGFRRPPGWVLVGMVALTVLVLLGRVRPTPVERVLVVVAALAGTAWLGYLLVTSQADAFQVDPSYVFYRRSGFYRFVELVVYQTVPLVVLAAVLARRWRPVWLPATLLWTLAFLPYATLPTMVSRFVEQWAWRLGDGGFLLSSWANPAIGWGSVLLLAVAVRRRWRRGRPGLPAAVPGPLSTGS